MNDDRIGYRAECYSPITRPYAVTDSLEIATICQGNVAGRIEGVTLPACSLVYRAGSIFGIRFEQTLFEGEITRMARMRDRTHISAGKLITDFCQFRTPLQSFSHFMADRVVVTFGPGYRVACLFREEVSNIADLFARTDGRTHLTTRIAQLTSDLTLIAGYRGNHFSDLGGPQLGNPQGEITTPSDSQSLSDLENFRLGKSP